MKRIAIMTVCVLAALGAAAQSHSFRDTSYVKYEQFDFDAWLLADSIGNRAKVRQYRPHIPGTNAECNTDILQYNYTDNPAGMKVVGLSAAIEYTMDSYYNEVLDSNVPAEYLLLYEADVDTFQELARERWYEADTAGRPYFHFLFRNDLCDSIREWRASRFNLNKMRVFDCYFDKPVTVYDSFYVGGTDYSDRAYLEPGLGLHEAYANYITRKHY